MLGSRTRFRRRMRKTRSSSWHISPLHTDPQSQSVTHIEAEPPSRKTWAVCRLRHSERHFMNLSLQHLPWMWRETTTSTWSWPRRTCMNFDPSVPADASRSFQMPFAACALRGRVRLGCVGATHILPSTTPPPPGSCGQMGMRTSIARSC